MTSKETVTSEVIGEGVCSSRPSGQTCGSLLSKIVDTNCAYDQRKPDGQGPPVDGDSGSPVYYGFKAIGVLDCAGSGSVGYYTPAFLIEGKWNVFTQITAP